MMHEDFQTARLSAAHPETRVELLERDKNGVGKCFGRAMKSFSGS
jgi:hypothetical protein